MTNRIKIFIALLVVLGLVSFFFFFQINISASGRPSIGLRCDRFQYDYKIEHSNYIKDYCKEGSNGFTSKGLIINRAEKEEDEIIIDDVE